MKTVGLILFSWLLLVVPSAQAAVYVFSGYNCTGSVRGYEDANVPNLAGQNYTYPATPMNDTIQSIFIDDGWEFWGCRDANYVACSMQVNRLGTQTYCHNLKSAMSGWQPDELPVEREMSSFMVQPNSFDSYWDYFGYKERMSDPGTNRCGFVELWDTFGFTGHNYKMYYTDTNLSTKIIGLNTRSLRIYGNLHVQLCLNPTCTIVSTVKDKQIREFLGFPPYLHLYGVRVYEASGGSAMATIASDFLPQGKDLGRAFLDYGPPNRKSFTADWEYGTYYNRSVWPSQQCYNDCNTRAGQGCPTDPTCATACATNIREFSGMFNEESIQYLGDVDLAFVVGHGVFTDPPEKNHLIRVLSTNVARDCPLYYPEPVHWANSTNRRDMGNQNLEWFLTASCQSLGKQSTPWGDVHEAWHQYLDSGVHGIGGFHRDSWWRAGYWDDTGAEIASRFWSYLTTQPVREAWFSLHEYFSWGTPDRCTSYMTAEECVIGVSPCIPTFSRWNSDYYWGYLTGPRPDLRPAPTYVYGEYCP